MTSAACSFPALGTTATVVTVEEAALETARTAVEQEIAAIDRTCSRFQTDSELVRLNARAGRWVEVSELLAEAVDTAVWAARATAGLVDPTVGRSLRLAGYDRTFRLVVRRDSRGFRASFAPAPGWRAVEVDRPGRRIRLAAGTELDLGATAKALASDRAAAAAATRCGCGVLVSLGGDVAVQGAPPAGGWSVRIADDHAVALDTPGPTVAVRSGGLATSSTAVRRWRARGAELHHILDPRSGRPAGGPWRAVTVAAASCVDANVAGTASILLGAAAPGWLAERRLPALLVAGDGHAVRVGGWPEDAA